MKVDSFWKRVTSDRRSAMIFVTAVCAVMLVIGGVVMVNIASTMRRSGRDDASSSKIDSYASADIPASPAAAEEQEIYIPAAVSDLSETEPAAEESADDLSELEEILREQISDYDGDWTIYVQDLGTGSKISINSRPMYAASVIKLFCAAAICNAVQDGNLREDEVGDLMGSMITVSDNFAFDSLVQMLPDDYITNWCEEQGYWDTQQNHCIASDWAYQVLRTAAQDNMTSVDDVGELLASMYRKECVSKESSNKIIKLLKKQELRNKIPAGLPKGVKCANKTGETDNTCHDSAIVWSDGGDYVIAVMGEAPGFAWSCNGYVVAISKTVYEYFNS